MVTDSAVGSGRRLERVEAVFDDEPVVASAGVLLASTLAERLAIEALVDRYVVLADSSAGSRAGAKALSLVHEMLLGADSIDDAAAGASAGRRSSSPRTPRCCWSQA
jgi:hypothetical protein